MRRRKRPSSRFILLAVLALALPAAELTVRAADRLRCAPQPAGPGFDLYAVGESTALGEPYNHDGFSLAALVSARLGGSVDGLPIRVVNIAKGGQSIFPQVIALERELRCRDKARRGGVLIYSGHNDAGPAQGWPLLMAWERHLPRSRLLEAVVYSLEKHVPALRARGPEHWLYFLRRAVQACYATGTTPVLATPVSDPRADPGLQEPGTDASALAPLAEAPCAELGALEQGAGSYRRPYIIWRRARCAEAAGRPDEAAALYKQASDTSVSPAFGRASTAQVAALRKLSYQERVPLADVEHVFRRPGMFIDVQHPSMEGYMALSGAYASAFQYHGHVGGYRLKDVEEIFKHFGCGATCRARALNQAGWFFLTVSIGHAAPQPRLAAARGRFMEALALDPGFYGARLGLALAQRPELLADHETLDTLGRTGVFFGRNDALDEAQRAELAALLGREP